MKSDEGKQIFGREHTTPIGVVGIDSEGEREGSKAK